MRLNQLGAIVQASLPAYSPGTAQGGDTVVVRNGFARWGHSTGDKIYEHMGWHAGFDSPEIDVTDFEYIRGMVVTRNTITFTPIGGGGSLHGIWIDDNDSNSGEDQNLTDGHSVDIIARRDATGKAMASTAVFHLMHSLNPASDHIAGLVIVTDPNYYGLMHLHMPGARGFKIGAAAPFGNNDDVAIEVLGW
jgi:hypothetical protein